MKLNLARVWRSKNFDQLIGQDLVARILKNSLYTNTFFPVYLFSGQKGCGKTSTARIFAAAVNCLQLPTFQQNPKQLLVPCLTCESCVAMGTGKHPDFIEIDAASHTGVDNVRQIIEAATLLPILGHKKIYLIDEAHMLSKAAFNAFLKLLEEPPQSVFFILATTDPHKIIETVLSRCFQLFFRPVSAAVLVSHLTHICSQESISCTQDGLMAIAQQSNGSVRDALNLLEQVRLSDEQVDAVAVRRVLGLCTERQFVLLIQAILQGSPEACAKIWQEERLEDFQAHDIWYGLCKIWADLVLVALASTPLYCVVNADTLYNLQQGRTPHELLHYLDTMYRQEEVFLKTLSPHVFLKYVLLKLCSVKNSSEPREAMSIEPIPSHSLALEKAQPSHENVSFEKLWENFMQHIIALNDPLISSMFKRSQPLGYKNFSVEISFDTSLQFFKDILENTKQVWLPSLHKVFGAQSQLAITFTEHTAEQVNKPAQGRQDTHIPKKITHDPGVVATQDHPRKQESVTVEQKKYSYKKTYTPQAQQKKSEKIIDVSDTAKWKKTAMVLNAFPGVVTEISEDSHG